MSPRPRPGTTRAPPLAQGLTIDRLLVDLGRVFTDGQAYVALSRAASAAGLRIVNLDLGRIRCARRALRFYEALEQRAPS